MLELLRAEIFKLRKTPLVLLIPLAAAAPVVLVLGMTVIQAQRQGGIRDMDWPGYMQAIIAITNLGMAVIFYPFFMGVLYAGEYTGRTRDTLLSYPYSRLSLFASKMILMATVIATVDIATVALGSASGFLILPGAPSDALLRVLMTSTVYGFLSHVALLPSAAALSLIGRSFVPAAAVGITATLGNILLYEVSYSQVVPWCIPLVLSMNGFGRYESGLLMNLRYGPITLSLASMFLVPLPFAYAAFQDRKIGPSSMVTAALVILLPPVIWFKAGG